MYKLIITIHFKIAFYLLKDSQYIKDMKEAIDSGNADLIQNDTMSAISVIQPDDYNHNLINFDSPKTDKTRHFE